MKRFARLNLKENSAMTTYTAANPADTSVRCGELTRTTAGSAASAPSLTRARGLRSAGALTNSEIRRSEERRVGKEWRAQGAPHDEKENNAVRPQHHSMVRRAHQLHAT